MKIWVDADATPNAIKEILVKASWKREIDVVFVANRWMEKPKSSRATAVVVSAGADVADDHIVEELEAGDLVISADIPLAARVVEKGGEVLTPYGRELDEENVREALSLRDFQQELRDQGVQAGGPPPFSESHKQAFANALDRWITKVKR